LIETTIATLTAAITSTTLTAFAAKSTKQAKGPDAEVRAFAF
jgi:hypothetical protein